MRTLLITSLLLSLVASIYSQQVPTDSQLQCITDASTAQARDIVDDCGSEDLTDLSSLCNSGACFNRLSAIYNSCGNNALSVVCGTTTTSSQQVPDTPTSDQLQCITDASTDQALDIVRDCGNADFTDLSSICNSGACFKRLSGIYNGCGYNGLSVACSRATPTTVDTTIPDALTKEQLECITDASNAQALDILNDCGNVDLSDLSSLCNSGACFKRLSGIYNSCRYNGLSVVCGGGAGGSGAEKLIAFPVLTLVSVALSILFLDKSLLS